MKFAFTLIELLIVVAIIGILAAIAVPNFLNAQTRAKIAHAQADMKAVSTAAHIKAIDIKNFPNNMAACSSYNQLTTPIAYLSSTDAAYDHFFPPPTDPEDPKYYAPGGNCYFFHWGDRISVRRSNKHFTELPQLIFSVGPNQIRDVNGVFGIMSNPYTVVSSTHIYDSTNGLHSFGDLLWSTHSMDQVLIDETMN